MPRIITYPLSDNLIENIADILHREYIAAGRDPGRVAVVFGGRRPALFMRKALSRRAGKGFNEPRFFTIDEFTDYVVGREKLMGAISDLDACFVMFNLVRELAPEILGRRSSFAQFLPWAREILRFIEQVDLEDISEDKIRSVSLNAEIGYDVPEHINKLLSRVLSLREAYHQELFRRKLSTRGLTYLFASRIKEPRLPEFDEIFFCNFFYLHKTQTGFLAALCGACNVSLIFQGGQEWPVLKDLARRTGWAIENFETAPLAANVELLAGFDLHSQVGIVRDALARSGSLQDTVVVLPDSHSLIPLVSEISGAVPEYNVSLGYPLKRSPVYSLLEYIARAQHTRKDGLYYAKDYLRALSHPLAKNLKLAGKDPAVTRILVHKVEEVLTGLENTELGGSLFVSLADIENSRELYELAQVNMRHMDVAVTCDDLRMTLKQLHRALFGVWEDMLHFGDFAANLQVLLDILIDKSFIGGYPLNIIIIDRLIGIKEEFLSAEFSKERFPPQELFKIFRSKLDHEMVAFSGSPLKSLQVLGLLETRSLNFRNVVVMDLNENVLPALKISQPLIPREVMVRLGLDQIEKEEEIQRYQFRRLISSAEKVFLVYEESSRNERSRFIEELIWERQKASGAMDVMPVARPQFNVDIKPRAVSVVKNGKELEYLRARTFSPSSVNTYVKCPMQFYYRYVLGLREKDDLMDELESADIGTFVHELLEEAFAGFQGRRPVIDSDFRARFSELLDTRFGSRIAKRMRSDSFMLKEILDVRMNDFLDNEQKRGVERILGLERVFRGEIPLGEAAYRFEARIDRVDLLDDGTVLVIDYKTGDVNSHLPRENIAWDTAELSREFIKNNVHSFQLPLYLYFVEREFKAGRVNAALYDIRLSDPQDAGLKELLRSEAQMRDRENIMKGYLSALEFIFKEMLDPEVPFTADPGDPHVCEYCPFGALCR